MSAIRVRPGEQDRLLVELPYDPERVPKIKTIPGRRWHAEEKVWSVPADEGMVDRLLGLFAGEEVEIDPALRSASDPIQETLNAVEDELKLRGYSPRTRKAYRGQVGRFLRWVGKRPEVITAAEVRAYLLHLAQEDRVSASYRNQALSALKFLYEDVLREPQKVKGVPRAKAPRPLPVVLSREEVTRLFAAVENLKHRAILLVIYAAGLRVSGAARLKVADVDGERRMLFVRGGKGAKALIRSLRTRPWRPCASTGAFTNPKIGYSQATGPAGTSRLARSRPYSDGRERKRGSAKRRPCIRCATLLPPTCWKTAWT